MAFRLRLEAYADLQGVCHVVICAHHRFPVFTDHRLARLAVDVIEERARISSVKVWAYCVMPDHVHLVVSPSAECSIIDFVAAFKSIVVRRSWKLGYEGTFWQESFRDRFVRKQEGQIAVVEYVLKNAVEEGLVDEWHEYPFVGSLELDFREHDILLENLAAIDLHRRID